MLTIKLIYFILSQVMFVLIVVILYFYYVQGHALLLPRDSCVVDVTVVIVFTLSTFN
jgi:hypothetical protein